MEMLESGAEKGFLQGRASRRVVHALKYPELPKRFGQSLKGLIQRPGEGGGLQCLGSACAQPSDWLMVR